MSATIQITFEAHNPCALSALRAEVQGDPHPSPPEVKPPSHDTSSARGDFPEGHGLRVFLRRRRPHSTVPERFAMRVGMWFLVWSTRAAPDRDRERLTNQQFLEREMRERAYQRRFLLERTVR